MTGMELKILDWLQTIRTPIGDALMCFITSLGNVGVIWIVLAVVLIAIPKTRKSGIIVAAATALYLAKERKLFATTLVLACLITFSRMYLYVHYPTDILGGLLLGIASAYLAYWCQKKIPAVRRNSEKLAS